MRNEDYSLKQTKCAYTISIDLYDKTSMFLKFSVISYHLSFYQCESTFKVYIDMQIISKSISMLFSCNTFAWEMHVYFKYVLGYHTSSKHKCHLVANSLQEQCAVINKNQSSLFSKKWIKLSFCYKKNFYYHERKK